MKKLEDFLKGKIEGGLKFGEYPPIISARTRASRSHMNKPNQSSCPACDANIPKEVKDVSK